MKKTEDRKVGPEETLWKEILTRAGMSEADQVHFLALARGRDLDISRIQRGQQGIVDGLVELTQAIQALEQTIRGGK